MKIIIKLLIASAITLLGFAVEAETVTYYVNDATGSPIAAMNSAGTVIWRESYNPFGEGRIKPSQNGNDIGFTGHQKDDSTGLIYMQARYYDPIVGRFYGYDPVGYTEDNPVMSFNRFAYANNNPYKYTDPDGKFVFLLVPLAIPAAEITAVTFAAVVTYALSPPSVSSTLLQENNESSEPSAPDVPDDLVGDQSDDRAGQSRGKRHNSGPLTPENGGTGNAEEDFDNLTGGTGKPAEGRKKGTITGDNGITIRPGKEGEGPRIDIPAKGDKPPETLHYDN